MTSRWLVCVVVVSLTWFSAAARAQQAPGAPAPPPTTVDLGTQEDANAGRSWMSPTALTPPAGTWSFSDYELLVVGLSYAVTDELVISADTMIPVVSGFYWGFVSGKLQILKQGRLRVALQGGVFGVVASSTDTNTVNGVTTSSSASDSTGAGEVGAAATVCLDPACFSHLDGFVGTAFAYQSNASVPVGFSASLVGRLARHIRFVGELDSAHLFGDISGQADGVLAWYGLRFTSRQIGVDAGLVRPFCSGCDTGGSFPLGFPIVSFTYRAMD